MPRNIPKNDTKDAVGIVRYLLLDENERKKEAKLTPPLNISEMNKRARKHAESVLRYLVLFLQRQPEDELAKVLPWHVARALTMSMLGDGCPTRTTRHHKIAQQMISVAAQTMFEMLGETHYDIVSKRVLGLRSDAFAVSPPVNDTTPNPGYKQNRQQIENDLNQGKVESHSIKIEVVTVNSPPDRIIENFINCGYFLNLTDDQQKKARHDPVEWLHGHPYLFAQYPQFFMDASTMTLKKQPTV